MHIKMKTVIEMDIEIEYVDELHMEMEVYCCVMCVYCVQCLTKVDM